MRVINSETVDGEAIVAMYNDEYQRRQQTETRVVGLGITIYSQAVSFDALLSDGSMYHLWYAQGDESFAAMDEIDRYGVESFVRMMYGAREWFE